MDFLQLLFLERPVRLGIAAFLLLAGALFARRRYIDTVGRKIMPSALALIALLFALQYFIVTDREEVLQALDEFVAAIESNNAAQIDAAISDQYESEGMTRDDIRAYLDRVLDRMKIYDARFHRRDVTTQDNRAGMIVAARATVSIEGGVGEMHWGRWRIDWHRDAGAWRITAIRPEMLDGQNVRGMKDLRTIVP